MGKLEDGFCGQFATAKQQHTKYLSSLLPMERGSSLIDNSPLAPCTNEWIGKHIGKFVPCGKSLYFHKIVVLEHSAQLKTECSFMNEHIPKIEVLLLKNSRHKASTYAIHCWLQMCSHWAHLDAQQLTCVNNDPCLCFIIKFDCGLISNPEAKENNTLPSTNICKQHC